MTRLTPKREAEIRRDDAGYAHVKFPEIAVFQRRELLAEIDALRAELADAEQRGRQLELADVLAWARGRGGQHTNGGTSAAWNHVRSWVAESLESGAHRKP